MRWVRALAAWSIESAGVPTGFDPAATLRAAGRGYARETIAASAGILGAYSAHHLIGVPLLATAVAVARVLSVSTVSSAHGRCLRLPQRAPPPQWTPTHSRPVPEDPQVSGMARDAAPPAGTLTPQGSAQYC